MTDDNLIPLFGEGCPHKHPDGRDALVPSDNPDYHRCEVCGDDSFQAVPDEELGRSQSQSTREMTLAARQHAVRFLENNPDPNPPKTKWRSFWDGFFSLFTASPPQKPVTAQQITGSAGATMPRAAAEAAIQVCAAILEDIDE